MKTTNNETTANTNNENAISLYLPENTLFGESATATPLFRNPKNEIETQANRLDALVWTAKNGLDRDRIALAIALASLENMLVDVNKSQVFKALGFTSIATLCDTQYGMDKASTSEYTSVGQMIIRVYNGLIRDKDGVPFGYSAHRAIYYSKLPKATIDKLIKDGKIKADDLVKELTETLKTEQSVVGNGIPKKRKTETPKAETPKTETPKAETPKAETPKAETPKAICWVLVNVADKAYHIPSDVWKQFENWEKQFQDEHKNDVKISK